MRRAMVTVLLAVGCGGKVSSDEEAELAWLGLETAMDRALDLGMIGYSAASSANIDPQSYEGDISGTVTVSGQVDQGSSDNKGLRLDIALVDYADHINLDDDEEDDLFVAYDTDEGALPYADLKLRDIPDGTLEGTLLGYVAMSGDLEGYVTLSVSISGPTESDGGSGVQRVEGETSVTGTATNDGGGVYEIDLLR